MALGLIVMEFIKCVWVNFSHAESSRAKLDSLYIRAASLSDVMEVFTACLQVIDPEAVSVLPGVLDLMVAKPGLTIERTLFVFFVELGDVFPAGIVGIMSHDALVREIVEISRVNSFY